MHGTELLITNTEQAVLITLEAVMGKEVGGGGDREGGGVIRN